MAISKQQQKSLATKHKIFEAAKLILGRDGYENLSIKNICQESGVSNGSFYHHFKTKDDLLSYYIEEQPYLNEDSFVIPRSIQDIKDTILTIYNNYANYCKELGPKFMANYYTPKNQSLNPKTRTIRNYPINAAERYLEEAILTKVVDFKDLEIEDITTDIRIIVIGNVFEWSMRNGTPDINRNIARSLSTYLDGLLNKYKL
ncbi:MAG: TetR/AcrR family transcriptional regulator [Lachnospiraceae bacterium]|jgi:AcrR family transcriptional regulator|nr:TetR/AcrR family transcriptional regulator [Lachnospiraceae bacterium]